MTDLKNYLEGEAHRVDVALPPVEVMLTDARRTRRRWVWGTGAGALALVVAGAVGVMGMGGDRADLAPATTDQTVQGPVAQGKWVGINEVGIDVPLDWSDTTPCETSKTSSWESRSSDAGADCSPEPAGVKVSFLEMSMEEQAALTGTPVPIDGWLEVDGARYRANVECFEGQGAEMCIGGVFFPDQEVNATITATGPGGRERIEELNRTVRIVPGLQAPQPSDEGEPEAFGEQQIDVTYGYSESVCRSEGGREICTKGLSVADPGLDVSIEVAGGAQALDLIMESMRVQN